MVQYTHGLCPVISIDFRFVYIGHIHVCYWFFFCSSAFLSKKFLLRSGNIFWKTCFNPYFFGWLSICRLDLSLSFLKIFFMTFFLLSLSLIVHGIPWYNGNAISCSSMHIWCVLNGANWLLRYKSIKYSYAPFYAPFFTTSFATFAIFSFFRKRKVALNKKLGEYFTLS